MRPSTRSRQSCLFRQSETGLPADTEGVGGINLGALGQRMRDRWRTVSRLWEENKAEANKMDLLGQLDYYGKLSSQLEWQRNPNGRSFRVVYQWLRRANGRTASGR